MFQVKQAALTINCTVTVSIVDGRQLLGWGWGNHFFHPVDPATGRWASLKGEGYRDWYWDSVGGLTLQDIAAAAGVGLGAVNGIWLHANWPTYGGTEATALAVDAAWECHRGMPDRGHRTIWLKRGGDYNALQEDIGRRGVSASYITKLAAYGVGADPIIPNRSSTANQAGYSLHEDVEFEPDGTYKMVSAGPCIALNRFVSGGAEQGVEQVPHFTMTNSFVLDCYKKHPSNGIDWTNEFPNRSSGLYLSNAPGSYLAHTMADQCGWAQNYLASGLFNGGLNGVPPSTYSHNIYLQGSNADQTTVGLITSNAASQGIQNRSGGMDRYTCSFASPILGNLLGKGNPGKEPGNSNYTLTYRSLGTQGRVHNPGMTPLYGSKAGDSGRGQNWAAFGTSLHQSLIAHHNDPNDPADTATTNDFGIRRTVDDPDVNSDGRGMFEPGSSWMSWGWGAVGSGGEGIDNLPGNIEGVNATQMNVVTIQRYTDHLLSRPPGTTVGAQDLIDHYRGLGDLRGVAQDMVHWFLDGAAAAGATQLARDATVRTVAQVVKAVLHPLGLSPGKRWDCDLDWNTNDYPGHVDGDSVELQGHVFSFSGIEHPAVLLNGVLGDGGGIRVPSSELRFTGALSAGPSGGSIYTTVSGRCVLENGLDGADPWSVTVFGGMFVSLGNIAGNTDITLTPQNFPDHANYMYNEGYAILATGGGTCTIGATNKLSIAGHTVAMIDGPSGIGTINGSGRLEFVPGGGGNNTPITMGRIRKQQSGLFGNVAPLLTAVVDLTNIAVEITTTGLPAGTYDLIDVDVLTGTPLPTITGTGSVSYATPGKLVLTV